MDTVPGNKRCEVHQDTQKSTISRYSCRIVVDRSPPHTARVFAAGFDKSSNIFLGVSGLHIKIFFLKQIFGLIKHVKGEV